MCFPINLSAVSLNKKIIDSNNLKEAEFSKFDDIHNIQAIFYVQFSYTKVVI